MTDTAPTGRPGHQRPAPGADPLDGWGVRVGRWAGCRETSVAAQLTRAYAAGGTERRNLFRTGRHAPGGLGGGIETVLPHLLDALAYAGGALKAALGSPYVNNAVATAALALALRQHAERSGRPADEGAAPAAGEGPNEEVVAAAVRAYERLRARRVDPATAEALVSRLVHRLLTSERPEEVAAFLDALVAAEPPAPVRASRRDRLRRITGKLLRRPGGATGTGGR
jgi:hypothetical protein